MRHTPTLAFASLLLAGSLPFAANGQSSGGNITGEASVGDTVTVTGVDTGFRRELKIDKDGKYQIRRVPTGDYMVVRVRKDGSIDPAQSISVRVGSTARVMEPAAKAGAPAAAAAAE
ncbi:MAG TPA: carboxypeptidase-like regulatory domain-containing protein [Thermomonas sp.]|nr:carboxypeptidase-like regulatory domain-containing protein [Thermomonas sp.]